MTLTSIRSLLAATFKHQLRGTALAALAFTILAGGSSMKAQSCLNSAAVTPAQQQPFFNHSANSGVVYIYAPSGCPWTLTFDIYEGPAPFVVFANGQTQWPGVGNGSWQAVFYFLNENDAYHERVGNIHIFGYPGKKDQIVQRAYPN
ncbi:MAG TPA: hypothetical protein VHU83_09775 [Bryobacteraceae bacterium]|jgi:hypothetical protein|nr:hypothetical protein [Bryobacteraceae bacterium]